MSCHHWKRGVKPGYICNQEWAFTKKGTGIYFTSIWNNSGGGAWGRSQTVLRVLPTEPGACPLNMWDRDEKHSRKERLPSCAAPGHERRTFRGMTGESLLLVGGSQTTWRTRYSRPSCSISVTASKEEDREGEKERGKHWRALFVRRTGYERKAKEAVRETPASVESKWAKVWWNIIEAI